MFDSLADKIREDDQKESNSTERIVRWVIISRCFRSRIRRNLLGHTRAAGLSLLGRRNLLHYPFHFSSVLRVRVVGGEEPIQVLVFVQGRVGKAKADLMNSGDRRGKLRPSGVPAEEIIVRGRFSSSRFDESQAGQQPPIQPIAVGGIQKFLNVFARGAARLLKERPQGLNPCIRPIIRRGGWLSPGGGHTPREPTRFLQKPPHHW